MKSDTPNTASDVANKAGQFVDEVKLKSTDIVEETGNCIGDALETANEKAADLKLKMESGYQSKVSPNIDAAQLKLASASRYLQEKDFAGYVADLEQFAREHPRITTAVSIIIGWKLGRALTFGK